MVVPILLNPANPASLSLVPVYNLYDAQEAFCKSNGFVYVLQDAVGVADGSTILDTLDDVNRQWVLLNKAAGVGTPGVTSFNGASGVVTFYPVIEVLSLAQLATIPVTVLPAYQNGQQAYVDSTRQTFVLQTATAGAANGVNVIATADSAGKQWVLVGLLGGASYTYISAEVDLASASPKEFTLAPAIAGYTQQVTTSRYIITAVGGVLVTGPTLQMGNNAGRDNVSGPTNTPSFVVPFANGVGGTNTAMNAVIATAPAALVSGAALVGRQTVSAAGTGPFALRCKFLETLSYIPL